MKKILGWMWEWFLIGMCMGMVYYTLEGIWHIPKGGYASIFMVPVGGLCGVLVGSINQIPKFYKSKIVLQSAIGTAIVLIVEFAAGLVLNVWLGLDIWDYSGLPFNIMGQICPLFALLWFILMPFAIWLEDWLRFVLWQEGNYYNLKSIYTEFIKCK